WADRRRPGWEVNAAHGARSYVKPMPVRAPQLLRSLRPGASVSHHLAPLLGLIRKELCEPGRREREHCATKLGNPRAQLGVLQAKLDLAADRLDHLGRRVLGRTEASPGFRLVARHELRDGRDVRQDIQPRRSGYA